MGIGKQQLKQQYFREQLALALKAADALRYSYGRVQVFLPLPTQIPQELAVQLEALTARFARLRELFEAVIRVTPVLLETVATVERDNR